MSCAQMSLVQHWWDLASELITVWSSRPFIFSFFFFWCERTDHLWHAEGYKQQRRQSEFTRDISERQNVSGANPEQEEKEEKINSKAG